MAGIKFDITSDNKNLLNSVRQAQTGVTNAISGIERAGMGIESTFSKIKGSVLGGFTDIAKGMAGLTALLQGGNFIKDLVADAGKFDLAMKEVSTLSEDVANNLQEYKDKVVDMTGEIPIKADEAAKALYQIESAGHHGADGLNVLKESAKGAIGGVTDTAITADAITTILNAYKMESSEAQHVSDLLFTTVRLGKTNMSQLGTTIAQVAPVAASFGVSIEDVLAAIASLTKQGTKTAVAVRQIRDAITATTKSMGDGAFQGRSFLDAMDEVALKAQGSNNALRQDLGTLQALNAVLSLTGKNSQAARQDVTDMQNSAGAAEAAYIKMASTAGAQTTILRNNILKEILPIADEMRNMSGAIAGYLNEAFDSGAMDHAIVSLEAFIATYAVYKSLVATTTAWNSAALGGVYSAQIAELQTLIPLKELDGQADLQSAVAKGTLTKEQALLVASLRGEVESRYEEIMAAETAARAELKAATAAEASAQANVAAAEEIYVAAQARMQAAIEGGSASEIEAAKEELNTAARLKNTAATELNTAIRQKNGAATMVSVTSKNADTAATLMNTTQEGANTVATGILATAKLQLKKAIDAVNKSFLTSPLFWIAATIAAVTYAVYKLVTAESAHEASVRKTNEALKNEIKSQNTQLGENRAALQRLQNEWNKLTNDKERKKWISDNKEEFQKLGIEVDTVKEAENVLVNNTGNVIKSMELRAKAAAYAAMATKKYQEALENREEAKNRRNNPTTGDKISGIFNTGWDFNFTKSIAQEANGAANKLYDAAIYAEREAEDFISEQQKLLKDADDLMKSSKVKSSSSGTKADKDDKKKTANTKKDAERRAKEAADQAAERVRLEREIAEKTIEAQRAAKESVEAAYIAGIEDEYERERAQEEFEHKKRLADIERKGEEMKKARYEANKKQWELNNKDKHYETDSEEGKKGWQGVSLSGNELVSLNAELAKENAEYERSARERAQNLIAAHQSYTDRKIQLDKEYANTVKQIDEEIAAANARGDQESVEALKRTKQQAATDHAKQQSALSLDILKESPEYIRAFEDLQQTSSETLEYLIGEFEKVKDSAAQSLDPKDLKEYTDIIQRMNDELGSRNPFKAMRDASIEAKKAHEEVVTAENEVEDAEKQLAQVREKGSHWVVTVDKSTGKLVTTYMTEEKAQEKVTKAKKKLATAIDKERTATEKHRKAEKKVLDTVDELCNAISNLGGVIGGSAGEIISLIGDVGSFALNVINTVNQVTQTMGNTATAVSATIRAVESASVILAVIGAALQIVQKITSMFGANYDEYNELVGQYEALVDVWDELIDKKQEYIKISYGAEVTKVGKEVIALLEEETKAWRKLGIERLNAGASKGSHSIGVRSRENMDNSDWIAVAKSLGRSTDDWAGLGGRLEGLFELSVEQLTKLREDAPAFWAKLDDDVKKYLNDIIEGADRIAEQEALMKERITGLSFDTAFDDLMDYMYEVADGSEDVMNDIAENWQQMINRMVVNNLIGNKMRERLEEWYNSIAEMQEAKSKELSDLESAREKGWITDYSYNISLDDINKRYEAGIEKQKEAYNDIVNSGKQQIEEFTELGLIKPVEDAVAELKVYFEDLKDSWIETLTDMTATTEDWKNELIDQVLSDLVESTILDAPLTVMVDGAEKQFDDFNKYLEDWTGRYKAIIEDQTLTDEERTARLKTMIQEQTDVREKQAAKSRSLAEGIGKDMKEAFSNSLDNLGDTLLNALLDTEKDAESMGREIASTLIKEMLQTMLASEKYSGEIAKIKEKWQQVLTGKNTDEEGNILFTMDDVLQQVSDLNDTIANDEAIKSLAGQYQELNKQIKNTDSLFGSIKDTFASSMMDMNKTADEMASDIGQTIAKNIIEQMVVSSAVKPLVDNLQKAFDAANVEGATYSSIIGDEAVQNALAELKEAFPGLQETAKGIMTGLGVKMNETAKQGFSDLKGTFINTLTDMDADAETLGKNLGKSMMEQMLNAMVEKEYKDDLKKINDEWADALEAGDPARLEAIKQKAEDLFATIENDQSIKKLADDIKALTDSSTSPFDNLRSSFLSALTDMSKSTADFTKDISTMIAQSFVDSFVMGDLFDEKLAKWKKKYKEITTDSSLSEEQRMKQLKGLSELIAGERDAMKDEVSEIYKMLGIREGQDQSATMNMAEAATYDQFELYLGMETSHLMVAEETKGLVAQVLSTLQGMSSLTNPSQNYGEQIFMRLGTTNEYLLAMKKAVEGIHSEFGMKIDRMNAQLAKWG